MWSKPIDSFKNIIGECRRKREQHRSRWTNRCGWTVWLNKLCFLWKQDRKHCSNPSKMKVWLIPFLQPDRSNWSQSECLLNALLGIRGYCSWASESKREQSSSLFCSLGWAPHTWPHWGENPSSPLCIWCVRCLLFLHPLMFPIEEESSDKTPMIAHLLITKVHLEWAGKGHIPFKCSQLQRIPYQCISIFNSLSGSIFGWVK